MKKDDIEELCNYLALEEVVPITGVPSTEYEINQVKYLKNFARNVIKEYERLAREITLDAVLKGMNSKKMDWNRSDYFDDEIGKL